MFISSFVIMCAPALVITYPITLCLYDELIVVILFNVTQSNLRRHLMRGSRIK